MILQNFYLNTIVILLASYLIGSFPSAYIAGKIKGIDIRKIGSRNVGGMNTITNVGKFAGVIVIITDIGKGALAAYLASRFSDYNIFIPLLAVVFAVIGHNWMVYISFKGGKGVSTFLGGLLYLSPPSLLFLYLLFIPVALFILKDSYLGTAIGFFFFSFFLWVYEGSFWWVIFGFLVTIVYSIKCYSFIKSYYTEKRKDVSPVVKKIFKPFFKGM
ncbi:MAG: glycerol-3-phosphate acyltransferase [Actinobacteria bacterium]|nr:glycerol-3-phosphate acyltransferase [Actinomycetota bacterium]MBL7124065.1 glycerol-3-phosphate acyltransferase [Actinomycetota bacterium]